MDFSNRSSQPQPVAPSTHPAASINPLGSGNHKTGKTAGHSRVYITAVSTLTAAIIVLIFAVVVLIGFGLNRNPSQNQYVNSGRLQAVFLNTGQVYFGNITSLNSQYYVLTHIFYLQTSSSGSSTSSSTSNSGTNVSLVKLGCELHAPYDQMVINASQVTFWENLQPTGQVAKAVSTWYKNNPNGQKCTEQTSAPTSSTNNVQGSTNTTSNSTSTNP